MTPMISSLVMFAGIVAIFVFLFTIVYIKDRMTEKANDFLLCNYPEEYQKLPKYDEMISNMSVWTPRGWLKWCQGKSK